MIDGLNKIQQNILHTIETVVKRKIDTAGFDKTISGRVTEVLDNNKYRVEICGSIYNLYFGMDGSLNINDTVWIKLPQGNMINAFICGIKR